MTLNQIIWQESTSCCTCYRWNAYKQLGFIRCYIFMSTKAGDCSHSITFKRCSYRAQNWAEQRSDRQLIDWLFVNFPKELVSTRQNKLKLPRHNKLIFKSSGMEKSDDTPARGSSRGHGNWSTWYRYLALTAYLNTLERLAFILLMVAGERLLP